MRKRVRYKLKKNVQKGDLIARKVIKELISFQREFRRHLATFIIGAVSFITALLWRDVLKSFIDRYENLLKELIPIKEVWAIQFFTAFAVSILAVIVIIVITKVLKVEGKK